MQRQREISLLPMLQFLPRTISLWHSHGGEYITIVDVSYHTLTLPHSTNVFWQEENIQVMLPHAWREIKLYVASKENQSGFFAVVLP